MRSDHIDAMPQLPPITQALILSNVGMFCLMLLAPGLERWLALWPLASGEFLPWQLATYAFLHGSMGHLFFNMLGLWMFGAELEQIWGRRRFMQFYGASVLSAGIIQIGFTALIGSYGPTVGASGGLFGLLMAYGLMFPNRTIMPLFPPIPMKARTFVAVFGGIELLMGVVDHGGGVAHFAHLGGMLGAWLLLQYWRGKPPFGGQGKSRGR